MSHDQKPREWTLEFDSDFDNSPPKVTGGPSISGYEAEVKVIEKSAYDAQVEGRQLENAMSNHVIKQLRADLSLAIEAANRLGKIPGPTHTMECFNNGYEADLKTRKSSYECTCGLTKAYETLAKLQEEK